MTENMSLDKSNMGGAGGSHINKASLSCPQFPVGTAVDQGNGAQAARRNPLGFSQRPAYGITFSPKTWSTDTFFSKGTTRLASDISIVSNDWSRK